MKSVLRAALAAAPDLVALFDHTPARVLGRRSAKTLRVEQDDRGLVFEIDLPSHEAGLAESVGRGDIRGASFAFSGATDTWTRRRRARCARFDSMKFPSSPFRPSRPDGRAAQSRTLFARARSLSSWRPPRHRPPQPWSTSRRPFRLRHVTPSLPSSSASYARGESFREWVEERSTAPKEYTHLRLGDVLRALITGPRTDLKKRALAEGTDSAGGYAVPDVLTARWIDRLRNALVVVQAGAETVPLTSDTVKIAKLVADPVAAWRSENAAVAESDPSFDAVTFAPKSLDVFTKMSRELLEEPIRQIVENAGAEGSVIVEKVKHETVATRGFDADSMEFVDMLQAGIIDPTKVERVALENAASIASLLFTTEALVTDIPEDKSAAAPAMPHGDMY